MRTLHGTGFGLHEAFHIVLLKDGVEQDYTVSATPCQCTCVCSAGRLDITFPVVDVARI